MIFDALMRAGKRSGLIAALVASALATACGNDYSQDPNRQVTGKYEGRPESDLRREVGPPTRERRVADTDANAPCHKLTSGGQGERELTYDVPSQGFEGRVRAILRIPPIVRNIVCVDTTGRIADVWLVVD